MALIGGFAAVIALVVGSLVLGLLSVLIDRLNFPQRPFRPEAAPGRHEHVARRDRTGAHIVDSEPDAADRDRA